jgi:hypothetical protein
MTKILSCAAVVGLLVASSSSVFAGGHGGTSASSVSPGQTFIGAGKTATGGSPGASGYSPGDKYNDAGKTTTGTHPGASVFAPGFLK